VTVTEAFALFASELRLADRTIDLAARRQQQLCDRLRPHLPIFDSFLTGASARYTRISPLEDAGVVVVRNERPVPLSSDSVLAPADALSELEVALRAAFPDSAIVVQARSVNVRVPEFEFGFHMLPAWRRFPDGYWLPDRRENQWIPSHPRLHTELIADANEATEGMLKPLAKMAKYWNAKNYNLLRAFHIELVCRDIVLAKRPKSLSFGMAEVLLALLGRVGTPRYDPIYGEARVDRPLERGELGELSDRLKFDAQNAIDALRLEQESRHTAAIDEWKSIFLAGFPPPVRVGDWSN
jgi:hypothetical protein